MFANTENWPDNFRHLTMIYTEIIYFIKFYRSMERICKQRDHFKEFENKDTHTYSLMRQPKYKYYEWSMQVTRKF